MACEANESLGLNGYRRRGVLVCMSRTRPSASVVAKGGSRTSERLLAVDQGPELGRRVGSGEVSSRPKWRVQSGRNVLSKKSDFPFVMCLNVRTSARTFRLLAVGRAQSQAGRARYLSLGSGVARVYGSEMTKED